MSTKSTIRLGIANCEKIPGECECSLTRGMRDFRVGRWKRGCAQIEFRTNTEMIREGARDLANLGGFGEEQSCILSLPLDTRSGANEKKVDPLVF